MVDLPEGWCIEFWKQTGCLTMVVLKGPLNNVGGQLVSDRITGYGKCGDDAVLDAVERIKCGKDSMTK